MTAPISLVPKPTTSEEIRDSVIRVLREALEQAVAGEINCVMMILGRPDGCWAPSMSHTDQFSRAIGQLEIAKQEWVLDFMREMGRA